LAVSILGFGLISKREVNAKYSLEYRGVKALSFVPFNIELFKSLFYFMKFEHFPRKNQLDSPFIVEVMRLFKLNELAEMSSQNVKVRIMEEAGAPIPIVQTAVFAAIVRTKLRSQIIANS